MVSAEGFLDVGGGELVQLLVVAEDDHSNVDRAEDGELMGLLEEAALALEKGDGAVAIVLDGLDLDLAAAHGQQFMPSRPRLPAVAVVSVASVAVPGRSPRPRACLGCRARPFAVEGAVACWERSLAIDRGFEMLASPCLVVCVILNIEK